MKIGILSAAAMLAMLIFTTNPMPPMEHNTVLETIAGFNGPRGIAITPDDTYVYVTDIVNSAVVVMDRTNNQAVKTISDFLMPSAIAMGKHVYYVADLKKISVKNLDDDRTIATIAKPLEVIDAIAITDNGENDLYAYVASGYSKGVAVIDLKNKKVDTITSNELTNPRALAITSDGKYAYVINKKTVVVINLENKEVVDTITSDKFDNPIALAITPDDHYIYIADEGNNTVEVIDRTNHEIIKIIPGFNGPRGIAITHNDLYAYVTNEAGNTVSVIYIAPAKPKMSFDFLHQLE